LKTGHTADRCWHKFEEDFVPEERHAANTATNSYTYDTNWYTDTGATDHITREFEKLAVRDRYKVASRSTLPMAQVCRLVILVTLLFIPRVDLSI
jgi:hypothetical protein